MAETDIITLFYYQLDKVKHFIKNPLNYCEQSDIGFLNKLVEKRGQKQKEARNNIIIQNKFPLISIVLPVLNSEKTIERAIISIQKQSYENWQLIVIDDGSTDTTVETVKNMIRQDKRIILIQNNQTRGVAYTRNVGLYHAEGDYITFHDADDRSHPERLEHQLAELCLDPKLKVVTFLYCRETKEGKPLVTNGKVKWNRVSGMMFTREVFNQLGYFKPLHISEDSEYHERIKAAYGGKASKTIQKLLYYSLFDSSSLLFSRSDIQLRGGRVYYKIKQADYEILKECRRQHRRIEHGLNQCYQGFKLKSR
jgi:glycosyltransferase involved in cell wall biosynthesis